LRSSRAQLRRRPRANSDSSGAASPLAVALEQPAQGARNGEDEMTVRDRRKNLVLESLREERRALGLAARIGRVASPVHARRLTRTRPLVTA
jgi:hypothetical protein